MPDFGSAPERLQGTLATILKKSFDGAIRSDEGYLYNVDGDLAILTANTGKDMYLIEASVTYSPAFTASPGWGLAQLKINNVKVEEYKWMMGATSAGTGMKSQTHYFKNIGHKVLAGQIIKIQTVSGYQEGVRGFIECIEVDTGKDPTLVK